MFHLSAVSRLSFDLFHSVLLGLREHLEFPVGFGLQLVVSSGSRVLGNFVLA
jgi:hypothetical protein